MVKVDPIKGIKSFDVLTAYSALLLGMNYFPEYLKFSFEEMADIIERMPPDDQRMIFKKAIMIVENQRYLPCIEFCRDPNNIPYTMANVENLTAPELCKLVVEVMVEMAAFKYNLLTEAEKKKLSHLRLTLEAS